MTSHHRAIEDAVLQGLGDVRRADTVASGQIGEGAGDAAHAGDGAGGQSEELDGALEQAVTGLVESPLAIQLGSVEAGIGRAPARRPPGELPRARRDHPSPDDGARLASRLAGQLPIGYGWHL